MLRETGLVTKVDKDIAWINTRSKLACSSCQVESTCGNAVLEKYLAGKIFVSKIKNDLAANVGDEVVIEIPKSSVSKASLLVYGLPLFSLILGALIGQFVFGEEWASILFAGLGITCGLAIIYFYNRKLVNNERFMPKMVSRVSAKVDPSAFAEIQVKNIE